MPDRLVSIRARAGRCALPWPIDFEERGFRVRGTARLHDGWLLLRACVAGAPEPTRPFAWALLGRQARLGPARYALTRGRVLVICAEVLAPEDHQQAGPASAPPERVEAALADVRRAARFLVDDTPSADEPPPPPEVPGATDWARLLREAGWPSHPRAGGAVVDLDAGAGFHQAHVGPSPGGGVRVGVEVARPAAPSDATRAATAVLLLSASGVLRMARPCLREEAGASSLRWEADLPPSPEASELDCALEALSAACRLTAREVAALSDERVAELYLSMRGWSRADAESSKEVNR